MSLTATVNIDEPLQKYVDERIRIALDDFASKIEQKADEIKYDSKKESCARLGVSIPTLDDAVKKGLIPAYRFGGRVLFKRSEVDAALKQIKSDKFYNGKA